MPKVQGFEVTVLVDGEAKTFRHGEELPSSLPKKLRDDIVAAEARGSDEEPASEPDPAPPVADPVADIQAYDDLSASDVVKLVTAENAETVKEYEQAHKGRSTITEACDKALEAATAPQQ